jgi:CRISPR-associated protein Csm1
MAETRDIIHLAALLHDIGKFYQRGDGFWNSNEFLKTDAKNLKGVASVVGQYGTPSHQHVYWTFQFLQNEAESFNKIGVGLDGEDGLYNLATFHHKPNSFLQGIITLADNWSSGLDREKVFIPENEKEIIQSDVNWGRYQYKKMPLAKIFNRLVVDKIVPVSNDSEQDTFDLEQLSITKKLILGKKVNLEAVDLTGTYKELWKDFEVEFKQLPLGSYKNFTDSLTYLLKKYTWCIPADTSTLFDNSLYEHLKVTASIAQCLYDYWEENKDSLIENNRHRLTIAANHFPLRLWCVDLSGIQKFIYDIASKSAAKSLKGRSFYIQMLLDGIADSLINDSKIKVTLSNLIYSSGGKFFLLLPNTNTVNERMKEIESEIKNELWKEYKGSIFICFGSAAWKYKPEMNKFYKTEPHVPKPDIEIDGESGLRFLGVN